MTEPISHHIRSAFVDRLRTTVRGYILRGMLILVPLGVTAYVLALCYRLTAGHFVPFLRLYKADMPPYAVVLLSVALFVVILYLSGFIAGLVIGRRLISLGEAMLRRIPLVKTVYSASRQAVDVLAKAEDEQSYQAAVMVPFPSPHIKSIAFVTGRIEIEGEGTFLGTFVPTTPNPTSGYFEIYHPDSVEHTSLTVEDAAKAVMSAGMLTPEEFSVVEPPRFEAVSAPQDPALATATSQAPKARRSWRARIVFSIRRRLLSGLVVLVPMGITVFIVNFIYDLTAGRITPLARWLAGPVPPYVIVIVSIVLLIILLYLTGYITTAVIGARLVRLMENLIGRLPVITMVYAATKQMVKTLIEPGSTAKFEAPVFIEFPCPGVRTIGFVVGRIRGADGKEYVKIFLPTSPNVTVGLLQLHETSRVSACNLSLEEALKMSVSAGLVRPSSITLSPYSDSTNLPFPSAPSLGA